MEHLENHPHAIIDKFGYIINIAAFQENDHDSQLLNDVLNATVNGNQIVCCCTFGDAIVGGSWDGKQFIPPCPHTTWLWNNTLKIWESPTPMPNDGLFYTWDDLTSSWLAHE
jgi:hypothetical protein